MRGVFSWLSVKDWRHILLVYLIVILVILGILAPIYWYADDMFVSSEMSRYESLLANGVSELSRVVTGINDAIYFTRRGRSFLSLRYDAQDQLNPMNLIEQQTIFKGYFIQQDAIQEAGLIFSPDLVLTTSWIFYPGVAVQFYSNMFYCSALSFEEWLSELKSAAPGFLPQRQYYSGTRGTFSAVTYAASWGSTATLYALIPVENLQRMFLADTLREDCGLRLTIAQGGTLYSFGREDEQGAYTLSKALSIGGVTATLLIPKELVNQRLSDLRRNVLFYLAGVLVVAITLTVLFACFATTKPLVNLSARIPGAVPARWRGYHSLHSSYQLLSDGISSMDHTIASQHETIRNQYLDLALLRGFLSSEEEMRFLQELPDFPAQYRLVLYRLEAAASPESLQMMVDRCSGMFRGSLLHVIGHNAVLLVMDTAHNHREKAARLLEEMQQAGLPVCGTVSDTLSGVDSLHAAYLQLTDIECCIRDAQNDHLHTSRDLPEKRIILPLTFQDLQTIYSALNTANLTLALSVLGSCTDHLLEQEENTYLYHHTYLMLRRILRQLQMENPVLLNALIIPPFAQANRNEVFLSLLPECFEKVCHSMQANRVTAPRNSVSDIMTYMDANLSDANLCVDSVASHFGISRTTLQKIYKEATGLTIASYIEQKRLACAFRLLTETDMTIAQVAGKCGFNSPNSFYKAFKRRYGMAPRSINGDNSSHHGGEEDPNDL